MKKAYYKYVQKKKTSPFFHHNLIQWHDSICICIKNNTKYNRIHLSLVILASFRFILRVLWFFAGYWKKNVGHSHKLKRASIWINKIWNVLIYHHILLHIIYFFQYSLTVRHNQVHASLRTSHTYKDTNTWIYYFYLHGFDCIEHFVLYVRYLIHFFFISYILCIGWYVLYVYTDDVVFYCIITIL